MSKIAEGKKENAQIRDRLSKKSPQQLKTLFKGLDEKELKNVQKAVEQAFEEKREAIILKKQKMKEAIEKEIEQLQS